MKCGRMCTQKPPNTLWRSIRPARPDNLDEAARRDSNFGNGRLAPQLEDDFDQAAAGGVFGHAHVDEFALGYGVSQTFEL